MKPNQFPTPCRGVVTVAAGIPPCHLEFNMTPDENEAPPPAEAATAPADDSEAETVEIPAPTEGEKPAE